MCLCAPQKPLSFIRRFLKYSTTTSTSQPSTGNDSSTTVQTVEYDFSSTYAQDLWSSSWLGDLWDVIIHNLCQDYRICKSILNKLEFAGTKTFRSGGSSRDLSLFLFYQDFNWSFSSCGALPTTVDSNVTR